MVVQVFLEAVNFMKKFVLGIIVGALLFGSAVFAADTLNIIKNPFPILINSKPTEVDGYNINGHTYLKVADLKKANLEVLFNETEKQIEISTTADFVPVKFLGMNAYNYEDDIYISLKDIIANEDDIMDDLLNASNSSNATYIEVQHGEGEQNVDIESYERDEIEITKIDGVEYIDSGFILKKLLWDYMSFYSFSYGEKAQFYNVKTREVIYDNIEYLKLRIDNRVKTFIKYDFWIEKIVPIIDDLKEELEERKNELESRE